MDLTAELERLSALHRAGSLTDAEFAAAKAAVLSDPAAADDAGAEVDADGASIAPLLEDLRYGQELAEIDRDWDRERENHMVTATGTTNTAYGTAQGVPYRVRPSRTGAVVTGVLVTVFGVMWMSMANQVNSAWEDMGGRMLGAPSAASLEFTDEHGNPIEISDENRAAIVRSLGAAEDLPSPTGLFPLFGLLFIGAGIFWSIQAFAKAVDYDAAEKRYQERRERVVRSRAWHES